MLSEIERERIFEVGEECEDLIDQIVICHAKGILDALYHNAHNFLTSCDGCYASGKFNESMVFATEEAVADNILGAESTLGKVDMTWCRRLNFQISTVSGLIMAKQSDLFSNLPSHWYDAHSNACIALTKKTSLNFHG